MTRNLRNRLSKIEAQRSGPGPLRVLRYDPTTATGRRGPFWMRGQCDASAHLSSNQISAFAGRFMLCPSWPSDAAWEAAVARQQETLLKPP